MTTSAIHDDVKEALKELQDEASDLEKVPGHELVRLYNSLRAASRAIVAAKRGQDLDLGEIKAGAGAIEDPLHPETAAAEQQAPTKEEVEARAAKEPDPVARENIRESAGAQAKAEAATSRRSSSKAKSSSSKSSSK
jgi:hypothetical protein